MKDDVYMIVEDGWQANKELTPEELFIERYFQSEQDNLTQLNIEIEQLEQEKEELLEEHAGEDSIFEEVKSDAGNITKGNVNKKIRELKNDPDEQEDYDTLVAYKALDDEISKVKSEIKKQKEDLTKLVTEKYETISEDDLKTLIVKDKWMQQFNVDVNEELDRVSQRLTARIEELAERYENTLPELEKDYELLVSKVDSHLQRMGFEW